MPSLTRKVFFSEYAFAVPAEVYEPAEDSFLFAENLKDTEGKVLDMGTGCGILGIVATCDASMVVAVDVNPYAVRCARENAEMNHAADRMFFVQGDLFGPLGSDEKFDFILFNAPYLPSESEERDSWLALSWSGGSNGRQIINRFIGQAPRHLKQSGRILLMQSSLSGFDETILRFKEQDLRTAVVAKLDLPFFETIMLLEARRF